MDMTDAPLGYGHGFKRGVRDVYALATSFRKNGEDSKSPGLESITEQLIRREQFGWVTGCMTGMAPLLALANVYGERGVTAGLITIGVSQAVSVGYEAYRLLKKPKDTQN